MVVKVKGARIGSSPLSILVKTSAGWVFGDWVLEDWVFGNLERRSWKSGANQVYLRNMVLFALLSWHGNLPLPYGEFRAQLLGTEKEIEGEMNLLSQSMAALYVQGSHSGQNTNLGSVMYGSGSSSDASSSNSQHHAHIPATTCGTIFQQPRGAFNNAHQHGVEPQMFGSNTFPPGHHDQSYGYGLIAQSNSGQQQGFRTQNYNGGYRSGNGNGGQYRNNSNNYRTGNNFRGRRFHSGNGHYSSGSRQAQNVTGSWSSNTEARPNVVIKYGQYNSWLYYGMSDMWKKRTFCS
ncbi:uncharacterized protein LOC126584342 [Malus sylvestris]|uniref:uncharacterized protein LOC126584342 n=1 Tax=Malus sylvestris TaxID=3752 RepID=UPI0021AD3CF1|nr:uncharacterized protein LOC126584342 [Malus sylvestris]